MTTVFGAISVQLKDDNGAIASSGFNIEVDDATTVAQLVTALEGFAVKYDAVTGCRIENVDFILHHTTTGTEKSTPDTGIDVTQTGTLNFSQAGGVPYLEGLVVPGIKDTLIVGGKVDLAATAVTDMVTWFTTAHTTLRAVSKALQILVALIDALFSFRKRRKAVARRSFPS